MYNIEIVFISFPGQALLEEEDSDDNDDDIDDGDDGDEGTSIITYFILRPMAKFQTLASILEGTKGRAILAGII